MKYIICLLLVTSFALSEEYELGNGYKINDKLHVGGYISTEYSSGTSLDTFSIDDAAFLLYGAFMPKMTYFAEFEFNSIYVHDFNTKMSHILRDARAELFYLDYAFSDTYKMRVGKQTTPVGYWNYEPINVLRDTTSNPLYSFQAFPKTFTGIDMYGFVNESNRVTYHLFMQLTKDLKKERAYVKSNYFYGLNIAYEIRENLSIGASMARYKNKDNKQIVNMFQGNAKYLYHQFEMQTEVAYNDISNLGRHDIYTYVQGKYSMNEYHAFIARYEYVHTYANVQKIALIGYSYRPIPGMSFKAEYQKCFPFDDAKILLSLSILF